MTRRAAVLAGVLVVLIAIAVVYRPNPYSLPQDAHESRGWRGELSYADIGDWPDEEAAARKDGADEAPAEEGEQFSLERAIALPERVPSQSRPRGLLPALDPDDPPSAAEGVRL